MQSYENLLAQSDLSSKFEAWGMKHNAQAGVDFAWEKKRVFGARTAAQGGVDITKPTITVGNPDNGVGVPESTRVPGKPRSRVAPASPGIASIRPNSRRNAPNAKLSKTSR